VNLNNIDLNKIATFCKVVESGGYRSASEVLNVTPSALSQSITSLEHALGFPLFQRVGKRLVTTSSGEKLYRDFRVHHLSFIQAVQGLSEKQDQLSGLLKIGAYLEFAKVQLAPVLNGFLKKHTNVQAKLVFDTPTRLHQLLQEGKLDLCFSIYPSREIRSIESKRVYMEELVLVSPAHILDESPTYEEVIAAPIVEYYFNHQPIRRWLALHFKKAPKNLSIRTYAGTAEMVLSLVREGLGIGVVPKYLLSTPEQQRAIRICRPTERKFIDHIWMLQAKGSEKPIAHRLFSSYVEKALSNHAGQ
jgi:LysR family transcriptional regulator, transcriptional activator of the cysJI operon